VVWEVEGSLYEEAVSVPHGILQDTEAEIVLFKKGILENCVGIEIVRYHYALITVRSR